MSNPTKGNPSREELRYIETQIKRETIPTLESLGTDYRPMNSYLMVVPLPGDDISPGGIILPNGSRMPSPEGHIIAVGPLIESDGNEDKCGLHVGDVVMWEANTHLGMETDDKKSFVLVRPDCIMLRNPRAKLEESAKRRAEDANQSKLALVD